MFRVANAHNTIVTYSSIANTDKNIVRCYNFDMFYSEGSTRQGMSAVPRYNMYKGGTLIIISTAYIHEIPAGIE